MSPLLKLSKCQREAAAGLVGVGLRYPYYPQLASATQRRANSDVSNMGDQFTAAPYRGDAGIPHARESNFTVRFIFANWWLPAAIC